MNIDTLVDRHYSRIEYWEETEAHERELKAERDKELKEMYERFFQMSYRKKDEKQSKKIWKQLLWDSILTDEEQELLNDWLADDDRFSL